MNDNMHNQELGIENNEALRLKQVMQKIKTIMNEKRERNVVKRLLLNKKKPKTKPQGW